MANKFTQNNRSKQYSLDNPARAVKKRISNSELIRIGINNLKKGTPVNAEYGFEEEKRKGIETLEKIIIMSDNISDIT